jgi:integrase
MEVADRHTLMDGRLHVYRRTNSRFWQCSTYLGGYNHRQSTHEENLALAMEFARDWYLDVHSAHRIRRRGGEVTALDGASAESRSFQPRYAQPRTKGPTLKQAADGFLADYRVLTHGERNEAYVAAKSRHVTKVLLPFFGDVRLGRITAGRIQEFRVSRVTPPAGVDPAAFRKPARGTLHQEFVTLRQILKWANRKGWISALPDMSTPYRQSGKVSHRAWFSPEEYKRLFEATRERARAPKNERWRGECERLHDWVLFMANTGLRPDESSRLEYRDVTIAIDQATRERILEIEVRGKRGVGYCKSMPGAVLPFERLCQRAKPASTDLVFGKVQRELFNAVLRELGLKFDREGTPRTAYSLRHTYICLRLMEGADIYQIAKNCRTSVEMIEKFYASHIKNTLDARAINVRKAPARRKASTTHQRKGARARPLEERV